MYILKSNYIMLFILSYALENPKEAIVIGIVSMIVGIYLLYRIFDSIISFISDIVGLIPDIGNSVKDTSKEAVTEIEKLSNEISQGLNNAFCFDENTMVVLKDGSTKKIIDVKIGDVLLNDSKVKGTMKFSGKDIKLTNYDGILTTSNHHVLHDGKFKRVSDVPNVINNIYDNKIQFVYDLETTDHRIVCLNNKNEYVVYTDYSEIDDEDNFIERYELSILNK